MDQISYDDFAKIDIRVGRIVQADLFPQARKPAYKLRIDFGDAIGVKNSSAQITKYYDPRDLIGRLVLGVVFFAHGAQKLLGWFGGPGFSGSIGLFTGYLHIPAPLAFLAIAAEFFGGLGLILGFLTRIAAFGIAMNMVVAIAMVHSSFGFFMNWTGTQKGEGFEYHLLALAITAFLMIRGAGAFSVDRTIMTASPARQPELVRS